MPQRRQNSMLRGLIALIFGTVIAPSRFSTSTQSTPRRPSSQASARPTGPAPPRRAGVSVVAMALTGSRRPVGAEVAHRRLDERHIDDVLGLDRGVLHLANLAVEGEIDAHAGEVDAAVGIDRGWRDLAHELRVL